jgi:hypothetical protein
MQRELQRGERAGSQEAAHRSQACIRARPPGARHWLRVGRPRTFLGRDGAGRGSRRDAIARATDRRTRKRAKQAQLEERVRFALQDYREIEGRFDRIVSVGMFEHVGTRNYAAFFRKIRNLLSAEGIALIHSIGRINGPAITSAWTRKYIFPGGHIPALSAPVLIVFIDPNSPGRRPENFGV